MSHCLCFRLTELHPPDWANLFHYVLQGLVTNELQEKDYFVDIAGLLPDLDSNTSAIVGFLGEVSSDVPGKLIASIFSLTLSAGSGSASANALTSLIECTVNNGCFGGSLSPAISFTTCYVFDGLRRPPCINEFDEVVASTNATNVLQCFEADGTQPSTNPTTNTTNMSTESLNEAEKVEMASCIMNLILPPGGLQKVEDIIQNVTGTIPVVKLVEEGGIELPGEVILSFFGWACYERGVGLIAPYKWWYCMGAVALFLAAIEILKLVAIQFIVWTNR